MQRLIRIIDGISEYSGNAAAFLIVPLILTIVYSVIVRYYFGGVVHWAFEMSIFFYAILVMIGGAYTLRHQGHVRVDVLPQYLGARWQGYLDILSFLVVLAVCCAIIYLGSRSAWVSTLRLERSSLQTPFNPPIWWFKWVIPLSAALIALQALAEIWRAARRLASGSQD